jgi:hypothetical protein
MTMAYRDPRLTNETLLRLAAWRLTHGPPRLPALPEEDGLCALLAHAARCGVQDLSAVGDDDLPTTSFTALLIEARQRQRQQEDAHGA